MKRHFALQLPLSTEIIIIHALIMPAAMEVKRDTFCT